MGQQQLRQRVKFWFLTICVVNLVSLAGQTAGSWPQAVEVTLTTNAVLGWEQDLHHMLARVQPYLDRYGYVAVFVAILVEGVGLLAPGQTLLVAAGFLAAKGGLQITWVLFWAFWAALLGPGIAYLLGRWGGHALLLRLRVNERHLHRFEGYFNKYGPGLILIARFFDGLRQLHGYIAGLVQMPKAKFAVYSFVGAAFWTGFWGGGAFLLDRKLGALHLTWRRLEPWFWGLTLLGWLAVLIYLRRSRRASR